FRMCPLEGSHASRRSRQFQKWLAALTSTAMALPAHLQLAPTPQELEYITGEMLVFIQPLFRMERVRLVSVSASIIHKNKLHIIAHMQIKGVYGPFRPPAKTKVPLWLAQSLKLKRKCRIVPPDWVTRRPPSPASRECLSAMRKWQRFYSTSPDDIMEPDRVRILLKDLREARQAKCRELLKGLDESHLSVSTIWHHEDPGLI
ncbi:11821_t:CDS:2, partial [Acaulospora colombiana]